MNKKNKGFTLIEILATIAIIAVVTLIATITYNKVRKNILNREFQNLKLLIESAGVKYASQTGISYFYVEELIDEGYLEPDDDDTDNIHDPRNHESLNCHMVQVVEDKSNYVATLDDRSYTSADGCDLGRLNEFRSDLSISAKITKTDINYTSTTSNGSKLTTKSDDIYKNVKIVGGWTSYQLDLTANISSNESNYFNIGEATYIWNKNIDTSKKEPNRSHTTSVTEFFNEYYYLDVYDNADKHMQGRIKYKYDKQAPVIFIDKIKYANKLDEFQWKTGKTLLIYATDNEGVGLDRVYAGTRPCEDLRKDPNMGTPAVENSNLHHHYVDDVEAGINGENGEINVCAIDKLGNLAKTETTIVIKIDITDPQCDKVIGDHNQYQWESRTVHQYCIDDNTINGKNVIGSGCTKDPFPYTWSTTTTRDYITIKDNVGHTTKCYVDVYVDRTAPICDYATGNTQTHKTNNNATTLGVGSDDNWDQNYRHITQYCKDNHVGCKVASVSKNWEWSSANPIIEHGSITIKDKVPKCSQKSVTSSNCANYDSIKDTAENLDNYNNTTTCTENVYIDHVPPVAYQTAGQFHQDNKIKVGCNDEGSGVNFFSASEVIWHNNSSYGANDGYTENGDTQQNTDGGLLSFMMTSAKLQPRDWADINIHTTCRDKAGNEETDKNIYFNGGIPPLTTIYGTYNQLGVVTEWTGALCGDCKLRKYRDTSAENCAKYSYECSCYDTPCGSTNSGMGRTCCLSGSDPYYGCKTHSETLTPFGDFMDAQPYKGNSSAKYVQLDGSPDLYYVLPSQTEEPLVYAANCQGTACKAGYVCLHFNCYVDKPSDSFPKLFVCGNYY